MGDLDRTIRRDHGIAEVKAFVRYLTRSRDYMIGQEQELKSSKIEIGRETLCDIRFGDKHETVSRRHAVIIKEGKDWIIRNNSDSNPTLINGRPVNNSWYLSSGDVIQLSYEGPKLEFITRSVKKDVPVPISPKPEGQPILKNENHQKVEDLNGLAGWLIFVGIGLVLTPIRMIYSMVPTYSLVFGEGVWDMLTNPARSTYIEYFAELVIAEFIVNIAVLLFSIFLTGQYFSKKSTFPKYFIGFRLAMILILLLDWVATTTMFPGNSESESELYGAVIAAVVWIPYMLSSERVKQTFVK